MTDTNAPQPDRPCEAFRSLADMHQPDVRHRYFSIHDLQTGDIRPRSVEYLHRVVAQHSVSDQVPEEIRIQWDTARNLWLYAWHVWRFYAVAEQQAYSTLETALRVRLGYDKHKRPPGLKKLMDAAINANIVADEDIGYFRFIRDNPQHGHPSSEILDVRPLSEDQNSDPQKYCRMLALAFSRLRNSYAHGSSSLMGTEEICFCICRDLINQLFRAGE